MPFPFIAAGMFAVGTTMSIIDSVKQKKAQKEAEYAATEAIASARKKLSVNYMDDLDLNMEAYEIQAENNLAAGAQLLNATANSNRGSNDVAGKIYQLQNQDNRGTRTEMQNSLLELDKLSAAEDARIADELAALDVGEAKGAQMAATDAYEASELHKRSAVATGANAIASTYEGIIEENPYFMKRGTDNRKKTGAENDADINLD